MSKIKQNQKEKELSLKDKKDYDPSKLDDRVLIDDHKVAHAWWATIITGNKIKGWSKEDVWNAHKLISQEMEKRGIKHTSPLPKTQAEHEAICKRCGECCLLKKKDERGNVYSSDEPCAHLIKKGSIHACDIYEERIEKNPICMPMGLAILRGLQPKNCPYVKDINSYRGPTLAALDYEQPISRRDVPQGEVLRLKDITGSFEKDIMLAEDFVSIVGGLCNHGETLGDIDILIKSPEPQDEGAPEGMATKFRISRVLAKLGIPEERIQFLYDDFHGPFTSHVHLYDLVLKLKPHVLHEMDRIELTKVTPFKFVTQPKPVHGRYKEEVYSPETVVKVVNDLKDWREQLPNGIYIERKFDGVRCQVHKVGKIVKIMTEEKTDITNKLPTLKNQFSKIKHDFVAEFELEHWMDGEHQSRADTAGIIHLKTISPHEAHMRANLYDVMWFDKEDIHESTFDERIKFLSKLGSTKNIKQSDRVLVNNPESLESEVKKFSALDGSEGAMLKLPQYKYPLKPYTNEMMKFKTEFTLNVEVVEKHDVEKTDAFNYLTIVRDGKEKIPAGRTYNTKINIPVGGFLKVAFVNLNKYTDPTTGKVWYNMWAPRPLEKSQSVDSQKAAEGLVKKSRGDVAQKRFPTRYESLLQREDYEGLDSFVTLCLRESSEEFNLALNNNWIKSENLVPGILIRSDIIRNKDSYIIRKDLSNETLVLLRDENNKVKKEIMVDLDGG